MPRSGWLALMPIVLCMLSGCLWTEQNEHTSFLKRLQSQPISPDHALLKVALLECPVGHEYINERVWQHADELVVDLERRAALDENGIRLGQLVGAPPSWFQQMLIDKRCCRNPEGMIFPAGKTVPIYLGVTLPQTSFDIVQGKVRQEETFDQARHCLDVTARFMSDGRTKLTFTPKVENGEQTLPFEAAPDKSAWEYRIEKACKKYPDLSWDVTLAPNQYFVIGARLDRERTLGQRAFTQLEGELGVQRLLVICNCRSVTALEAHQTSVAELLRNDRVPPLALQATLPVSRAKSN